MVIFFLYSIFPLENLSKAELDCVDVVIFFISKPISFLRKNRFLHPIEKIRKIYK
jgi:hypothetical protein